MLTHHLKNSLQSTIPHIDNKTEITTSATDNKNNTDNINNSNHIE